MWLETSVETVVAQKLHQWNLFGVILGAIVFQCCWLIAVAQGFVATVFAEAQTFSEFCLHVGQLVRANVEEAVEFHHQLKRYFALGLRFLQYQFSNSIN